MILLLIVATLLNITPIVSNEKPMDGVGMACHVGAISIFQAEFRRQASGTSDESSEAEVRSPRPGQPQRGQRGSDMK